MRHHIQPKLTKPKKVSLTDSIPVLMLYHTVIVGEAGEVYYLKDIYGRDAKLMAEIEARRAAAAVPVEVPSE